MGEILAARRRNADSRLLQLRQQLKRAQEIAADKVCVYVTGSFGRGEASSHSDLDIFIVGKSDSDKRRLGNLDEICLKAELITVTRDLRFPEFSRDGEYLLHHSENVLVKSLGKADDDAKNTFTARLLLLLESRPLIGEAIYSEVINNVIDAYWRDYQKHKNDFIPAFLGNDILRLWRTFCVNYEAGTSSEPKEKRAKRKLKNHKLRHSRLLTCYSALLYLLAIYGEQRTVHPEDAVRMAGLSPTERLEWILGEGRLEDSHESVRKLLKHYERFLTETDAPEEELVARIIASKNKNIFSSAGELGDITFALIESIGRRSEFHRVLVV